MKRAGFTLIEMMISIVILSIIVLFLYQSYSSLNISNAFYKKRSLSIKSESELRKIIYMDFSLALKGSVNIINKEKKVDILFMQSSHSLHRRFNPYIAYIVKEKKLYRLESLVAFKEYPLGVDSDFVVEYIGEVKSFRVYKNNKNVRNSNFEVHLIHIDFKEKKDVLLKVTTLNEL